MDWFRRVTPPLSIFNVHEQQEIPEVKFGFKLEPFLLSFCVCFIIRNEDRDDRNRKTSYDVKEGTADCEDWSAQFNANNRHAHQIN